MKDFLHFAPSNPLNLVKKAPILSNWTAAPVISERGFISFTPRESEKYKINPRESDSFTSVLSSSSSPTCFPANPRDVHTEPTGNRRRRGKAPAVPPGNSRFRPPGDALRAEATRPSGSIQREKRWPSMGQAAQVGQANCGQRQRDTALAAVHSPPPPFDPTASPLL